MAKVATQEQFQKFLKLSGAVQRQVEAFNRQEDARIEAAIKAGVLHSDTWKAQRDNAVAETINQEVWVAEGYEGRNGAPMVPFRQIQALIVELKPIMEQGQPIAASQELALEYALMAAGIA